MDPRAVATPMHSRANGVEQLDVVNVASFNVTLNTFVGDSAVSSYVVDELNIGRVDERKDAALVIYLAMKLHFCYVRGHERDFLFIKTPRLITCALVTWQ